MSRKRDLLDLVTNASAALLWADTNQKPTDTDINKGRIITTVSESPQTEMLAKLNKEYKGYCLKRSAVKNKKQ